MLQRISILKNIFLAEILNFSAFNRRNCSPVCILLASLRKYYHVFGDPEFDIRQTFDLPIRPTNRKWSLLTRPLRLNGSFFTILMIKTRAEDFVRQANTTIFVNNFTLFWISLNFLTLNWQCYTNTMLGRMCLAKQ